MLAAHDTQNAPCQGRKTTLTQWQLLAASTPTPRPKEQNEQNGISFQCFVWLTFFLGRPLVRHEKGTHGPKLLSPDIFWWDGGLPREGVGTMKSRSCPRQPRESNFFGGISRDFAGISRKRPKSLRKKCLGSIFGPYLGRGHGPLLTDDGWVSWT